MGAPGAYTAGLLALAVSLLTLGTESRAGAAARDDETADLAGALQKCRKLADESRRLACYERLARNNAPADYSGRLGFRTPVFTLDAPTRLRYRSQGVIFVLYVLNERGEVLQNLHLGGGGDGDYVIPRPGRYRLQIDGSARWQIWLEALEADVADEAADAAPDEAADAAVNTAANATANPKANPKANPRANPRANPKANHRVMR